MVVGVMARLTFRDAETLRSTYENSPRHTAVRTGTVRQARTCRPEQQRRAGCCRCGGLANSSGWLVAVVGTAALALCCCGPPAEPRQRGAVAAVSGPGRSRLGVGTRSTNWLKSPTTNALQRPTESARGITRSTLRDEPA